MHPTNIKIGFIGQGFIGKNLADDFEKRGYSVFRYSKSLDTPENRAELRTCDIVFIGVPTPTTPQGFNYDILKEVIGLVGSGKTAVIKSTMMPGTSEKLQELYPDVFLFHSPEFLTEKYAAHDVAHPTRNIVGYAQNTEEYKSRAQQILDILPDAPLSMMCNAREAELIKYGSNNFLYLKVVYANILYDIVLENGMDWGKVYTGITSDPRIGESHMMPVLASGISDHSGRGAGGHCFIKDFAGFIEYARSMSLDDSIITFLRAAEETNKNLLIQSKKDLDLLQGVYGDSILS